MARLLIAEDDAGVSEFLEEVLTLAGHQVTAAENGLEAYKLLNKHSYDILLTDLFMPGMDGMSLLRKIREEQPELQTIMMTADGSIPTAVEAMKLGALDYLQKPFQQTDELELVVNRALELRTLLELREHIVRGRESGTRLTWGAKSMKPLVDALHKVARTQATVLLLGESGTGKEVTAEAVHRWSDREGKPFIAVNCAALSESLIESELFGHEKGAFTGAHERRRGRVELAHGGTFFLDEIGELRLDLQAKLLRVMDTCKFERVGGSRTIEVDVRWIAATHRDLPNLVREGSFREDLYHRLAVFPLQIPPLRERREDILPLAEVLLERIGRDLGRPGLKLDDGARDFIQQAAWAGNVRELRNSLERATILADTSTLRLPHFLLFSGATLSAPKGASASLANRSLEEIEKEAITQTLEAVGSNRRLAAERLGISVRSLYNKLKQYNLQ